MGLYLIWLLAKDQINGSLKINTEKGTAFRISFQLPNKQENADLLTNENGEL